MNNVISLTPERIAQAWCRVAGRHLDAPKLAPAERARKMRHAQRMLTFAEQQRRQPREGAAMTEARDYYVYVLFRETGAPFYIGKGRGTRWLAHERQARNGVRSHRANIIRKMLRAGLAEIPAAKIAEGLSDAEASAYEIAFIAAIGRKPFGPLINQTAGGDGVKDPSPAARAKMAAGQRGRIASPATRAKQRAAKLGTTLSLEHKAKIGTAGRGKECSPETRAKIGATNAIKLRGTKQTPERRAKSIASLAGYQNNTRGIPLSSEHKAKISAANLGHGATPETRAKIGAKHKGKTVSPEARAKMRAAKVGKPQAPEWIAARIAGMARGRQRRAAAKAAAAGVTR